MDKGIQISLADAAQAIAADVVGDNVEICGVETDSREIVSGNLFIARRGDESDGHKYIAKAIEKGAAACVVERSWAEQNEFDFPALVVDDSSAALGDLAAFWRKQLDVPVVAITGSNGKTTTKEMLAHVLGEVIGPGCASIKSYNNHVGLPVTILSASKTDKWLVLEAGMNHPGELSALGNIASPDIAVVLNVADAHRGFFSSTDEIADAKCELLQQVRPNGIVLRNLDNKFLTKAFERIEFPEGVEVKTFSLNGAADYCASAVSSRGLDGIEFELNSQQVAVPQLGSHNAYNATACLALADLAFPDVSIEKFSSAIASAPSAPMRLEVEEVGGVTLLNDCYNANPASVLSALKTASELAEGRNFSVVLGDMFELGSEAERLHKDIAKAVVDNGCNQLLSLGEYSELLASEAKKLGLENARASKDASEIIRIISEQEVKPEIVLVKGSRGMAMERVVEGLKEIFERRV